MNTILKKKALEIIELAYGQVNEDVIKRKSKLMKNMRVEK